MKKSIVPIVSAFLLMLIVNLPAKAQKTNSSQFGIKGGVNFANLYTKDAESNNAIAGFNVGIFSKIPISGTFAFQPEIYFTTKGAEVIYNNAFANGTASFKLNYIEIPLLFVLNVTDNFSLYAGPYAAYLVSGNVKNKSNVTLFDFEENINADDYNRFDAGIAGGASLDFRSVSFGARYSYGLNKVGKEKTFMGTSYTFPDANNGVLSLYMQIPLHKN
jgi:hypothetical protein